MVVVAVMVEGVVRGVVMVEVVIEALVLETLKVSGWWWG